MLLTISTTHRPATDLGFLLHKHPDRLQAKELPFGAAHFFYPEAEEARCTFALLLDVNPVDLVRGKPGQRGAKDGLLAQYVNDRPYAASSFLSVAISRVLASALGGRSEARAELAETPIPLTACVTPLPCRGDDDLLSSLFEPLGYEVERQESPLDERFPDWGPSPYAAVTLSATCRLKDLLSHLYVLIPVLDNRKHYFVGENEVEKLLRFGEGWLAKHPMKELVARRYLKHRKSLAQQALERLVGEEEKEEAEESAPATQDAAEQVLEKPIRLYDQRLETVVAAVKESGAKRVLDLGCVRATAPRPAQGNPVRGGGRPRRFDPCPGIRRAATAPGPHDTASACPHPFAARCVDLSGRAARRVRRGGPDGGDRASRSLAPRRAGALPFRRLQTDLCRGHDTEPGIQREVRDACRRRLPPSRSPLRVDPGGVPVLG